MKRGRFTGYTSICPRAKGTGGGVRWEGERGVFAHGVLPESTVGVCDPLPKTLTILRTKSCDFLYPNYDLTTELTLWGRAFLKSPHKGKAPHLPPQRVRSLLLSNLSCLNFYIFNYFYFTKSQNNESETYRSSLF